MSKLCVGFVFLWNAFINLLICFFVFVFAIFFFKDFSFICGVNYLARWGGNISDWVDVWVCGWMEGMR